MTAWVVRAGLHGEREQWALDNSVAGGGFSQVGDLTSADTRTKIRTAVDASFPNSKPGRLANFAGQLLAMRSTIQPGDVIVMPMKTSKRIAVGVCTGGYRYRSEFPDPSSRHTISVDWKTADVARSAIKDDLLNTLGGAMTIFQASRNNAEVRIRAVMETSADPGTTAINIRPTSASGTFRAIG